jgi:hypothetical protein
MAVPDLFLYLCTHATRDGLGSLRMLLDIALMVERFGLDLPWAQLITKVKAAHIQTPVTLSLHQCQELLGAEIPPEFLTAIKPPQSFGLILGNAVFRWRGGVLHSPLALLRSPMATVLAFLWEDSLYGKLQHLRRVFFPAAGLRARWMRVPLSSSSRWWYPHWLRLTGQRLLSQMAHKGDSRHS